MDEDGSGPLESVDVTRLLAEAREGDRGALEEVFPLVYEELRGRAAGILRGERAGHTLQPTALVNEAYLKLVGSPPGGVRDRRHFLALAARAMRQVLVDHARRKKTEKRGGDLARTTLSGKPLGRDLNLEELLALDEALKNLEVVDPDLREVVECRFFAGLTEEEIAAMKGVSTRTVQRQWVKARAWLYGELYPDQPPPG